MKILPFKSSPLVSLGVELEYQLINPHTFNLATRAKDLIRHICNGPFKDKIKPEITQGMIEINSSTHLHIDEMKKDLLAMHAYLLDQAKQLSLFISGGGTHAFQRWARQKIFPSRRFKNISRQYRYLSKRSTVFGQHVHVGCPSSDDAIYLTHAFSRYVPQLIAISAASPFYQGIDTEFHSSRSNVFSAFPLSGFIPYLTTWQAFSNYYYKMKKLRVIESMKDFYWDIRPKPEFGTVEIRVCDTPLTIQKSLMIAAYIQTLSCYLLKERPFEITEDFYFLHNYNKFQGSRYGYDGDFINPCSLQHESIANDILETLKSIETYAHQLQTMNYLNQLKEFILNKKNDTTILKKLMKELHTLPQVVKKQCELWEKNSL